MYIISNNNGKYNVRNCSPFRFQQKTNLSTLCSHLPNSHVNLTKIFCKIKPVNPVTQQSIWAAGGWNKEKAKHANNQFYKCFSARQKNLCVKCNIQTINIISEQSFTDTALIYVHWVVWKMMWILITQYSWLNKQPV